MNYFTIEGIAVTYSKQPLIMPIMLLPQLNGACLIFFVI